MKRKILSFFTLALVCISCLCHAQTKAADEQCIKMIKDFYTSYITLFSASPSASNTAKQKALKKKHCTESLLRRIEKKALDYDPFLNAQDSDPEWLKTLAVKKDPRKTDGFLVTYRDAYNNSTISIIISVVKHGDSCKINHLW